jgi:hypothetical protein
MWRIGKLAVTVPVKVVRLATRPSNFPSSAAPTVHGIPARNRHTLRRAFLGIAEANALMHNVRLTIEHLVCRAFEISGDASESAV